MLIFPIFILIIVNLIIIIIFKKLVNMKYKSIFILFLYWGLLLFILNFFLYSIWRELSINMYFFEIKIIGKDAFSNFEATYKSLINQDGNSNSFLHIFGFIILPAILEETWKLYMLIRYNKNVEQLISVRMYIYSISIIALWFSFFENISYIFLFIQKSFTSFEIVQTLLLRIIMSTSSHLFFSWVVWYYFARYMFAWLDIIDEGGISKYNKQIKILKKIPFINIHNISKLYWYKLLFTWIFYWIIIHIIYNFFINLWFPIISFLIIVIAWGFFYSLVLSKEKLDYNLKNIDDKMQILKKIKYFKDKKKELIFHSGESNEKL